MDAESEFREIIIFGCVGLALIVSAVAWSAYKYTGELKQFRAACESADGQAFKGREEWLCLADGRIVLRMHN